LIPCFDFTMDSQARGSFAWKRLPVIIIIMGCKLESTRMRFLDSRWCKRTLHVHL
jgi:hypothetical protein